VDISFAIGSTARLHPAKRLHHSLTPDAASLQGHGSARLGALAAAENLDRLGEGRVNKNEKRRRFNGLSARAAG
jgi:hypothetical protein